MKSNAYWDARAAARMDEYLRGSDDTLRVVSGSFRRALANIEEDMARIFGNYAKRHQLTPEEARTYLGQPVSRSEYLRLLSEVDGITDPALKRDMLARINAPAYQYRMSRLEAVQESIYANVSRTTDAQLLADTAGFQRTIREAYGHTIFDIQRGTGYGFRVNAMSAATLQEILRNPWSGEHYSNRIWQNGRALSKWLEEDLTAGMLSGKSWSRLASDLEGRMGVGYREAERLVRTESVYMANAAEMQGYKECGIDQYRFLATLDNRTSDACQANDNKVFYVSEAVPGENMPPLHPNCRSTTTAVFDDMDMANFERMARDPVTGENYKVPASMSFGDWINSVDERWGDSTFSRQQAQYNALQAQKSADKRQWNRLSEYLPNDTPSTLTAFRAMKYREDDTRYKELLLDYRRAKRAADTGATFVH